MNPPQVASNAFGFGQRLQMPTACGLLDCRLQSDDELTKWAKQLGLQHALMGVRARNDLQKPDKNVYNCGYIVNMMSTEEGDGSHWMVLWYMPTFSFYFDPVGIIYPPLEVLAASRRPLYTSSKLIQHFKSCQCGLFCLKFMYHLYIDKMSVQEACEQFSDVPVENDKVLNDWFCKHNMCIGKPNTCR